MVILIKLLHSKNAHAPICVTLSGIVTFFKFVLLNAPLLIVFNPLENVTLFKE